VRKSLEDVIEETCRLARWADYFETHVKPYVHFEPEAYRTLAESIGFQVLSVHVKEKSWDFKTREAFAGFCRVPFVEWTRGLPQRERETFIEDVLDAYRSVAAENPQEANTFKFYQMEIRLAVS
jgi:trans-aconitate 2-methyltransferase